MNFDRIDRAIASAMGRFGTVALRISLGIIFVWFGILKPLGISAAAPLVLATVDWMPLFAPETWLVIIGWWEVAIALLALQMFGTFMPLIILPEVTFQPGKIPYGPTMEGQYIIKNLLIISAALVVGGTVRRVSEGTDSTDRGSGGREE